MNGKYKNFSSLITIRRFFFCLLRKHFDLRDADRPIHGLQPHSSEKIAIEIQLTDYEKSGTDKVMELIEHLEYIKEELHKLIAISEEGAVAHDDSLRHDVKIARDMIPKLEEIVQLHIDSQKGAELEKILTEFAQRIKKCL